MTSCVVAEVGKKQLYECMDTRSDLESCKLMQSGMPPMRTLLLTHLDDLLGGGCLYPDLRYGNSTKSGMYGRDCTSLVSLGGARQNNTLK